MSTVFKGDNSTISLIVEDNGWGKPPSSYAGGRMFQNNDGTFNATRNSLQSEARTPNAELGGIRLGNRNVAGSFPVEVDPENYNRLFESVLYGRFQNNNGSVSLTGEALASATKYQLDIPLSDANLTTLDVKVGDMVLLSGFSDAGAKHLEGTVVVLAKQTNGITVFSPEQTEDNFSVASTDMTVANIDVLRPAKQSQSFNAEETLYGEDGTSVARFMTAGAVVSSAAFDMPSDGTVKTTFSMLGSGKFAGSEYTKYDPDLTNNAPAHTSPVPHKKYSPLVLQDGKFISEQTNTMCQLASGSLSIENGTELHFVGCSYDAAAAVSGKLTVNLSFEAMFQSDEDYKSFDNEVSKRMMIRLKDRNTNRSLVIYLPSVTTTAYNINNSQGIVTASLTAVAVVDPDAINSIIIGSYYG